MRGTYLWYRRVGQWMIAHGGGKVINIGSAVGIRAQIPRPSYEPAKAAIIHNTVCLAVEWAPYKINVNCISPGFIETPFQERNRK